MRFPALAAILALGVLATLSSEKLPAAAKKTSPPRPTYVPPARVPPAPTAPLVLPRVRGNYGRGVAARMATVQTAVTFTFNSDVGKVRVYDPPENFDEKGNVKKYTRAELQKLKGDDPAEKKLPGYKTDFSELQVGDTVQVSLSRHKTTPAKDAGSDAKKSTPDADADAVVKDASPKAEDGKWVVTTQLLGQVTKIDSANTDAAAKVTIRVTTTRVVSAQSRTTNTQRKQTIQPEQAQATLIVIGHRQSAGSKNPTKP